MIEGQFRLMKESDIVKINTRIEMLADSEATFTNLHLEHK